MKEDIFKAILDALTPEDIIAIFGCAAAGLGVGSFIVVTRHLTR